MPTEQPQLVTVFPTWPVCLPWPSQDLRYCSAVGLLGHRHEKSWCAGREKRAVRRDKPAPAAAETSSPLHSWVGRSRTKRLCMIEGVWTRHLSCHGHLSGKPPQSSKDVTDCTHWPGQGIMVGHMSSYLHCEQLGDDEGGQKDLVTHTHPCNSTQLSYMYM